MTSPTNAIKAALQEVTGGLTRDELRDALTHARVDAVKTHRALQRLLTDRVVLQREGRYHLSPTPHARRYLRGRRTGRVAGGGA